MNDEPKILKSMEISAEIPGFHTGLEGMVEATQWMMRRQAEDEGDVRLDLDECICLSGMGFAHYLYRPGLNLYHDDPSVLQWELGALFCNYGVFESLGYFCGFEIQEFDGVPVTDFFKLVAFEIAQGRPVLTLGIGDRAQPALIVGYDLGVECRRLRVVHARDDLDSAAPTRERVETIDVTEHESVQGELEHFHNWSVIVRRGERPDWGASSMRQRLDVLRWAVRHARNQKEFFHETRVNYATGLRAWSALEDLAGRITDPERERDERESLGRYLTQHLRQLECARRAAAGRLERWAELLAPEELLDIEDIDAARAGLRRASRGYSDVADELVGIERDDLRERLLDGDDGAREELVEVASEIESHEREAVEGLESALEQMPRRF
jgi:hypothetical protein